MSQKVLLSPKSGPYNVYGVPNNPYKDSKGRPTNGASTGAHLHLTVKEKGALINPLDLFSWYYFFLSYTTHLWYSYLTFFVNPAIILLKSKRRYKKCHGRLATRNNEKEKEHLPTKGSMTDPVHGKRYFLKK